MRIYASLKGMKIRRNQKGVFFPEFFRENWLNCQNSGILDTLKTCRGKARAGSTGGRKTAENQLTALRAEMMQPGPG
jgi:hypothetical protein